MHGLPARSTARLATRLCLGLALLGAARPAAAQCQVAVAPAVFDPSPGAWAAAGLDMAPLPTSIAVSDGPAGRRLVTRWTYGFAVYSATDPARPGFAFLKDMLAEGYPKEGDGSDRTGTLASSTDGTRVVLPWTDVGGYGTVVELGVAGTYVTAGDYEGYVPYGVANQTAVLTYGSRYLGFTLVPGSLLAADITAVQPIFGTGFPGSISSERVPGVAPVRIRSMVAAQGAGKSFLVINAQTSIIVVDVTNPGPAGPALASRFVASTLKPEKLFPTSMTLPSQLVSVAAAVHPVDGGLYIAVEGGGSTSEGIALVRFDEAAGTVARQGFYLPAAPMNGTTNAAAMVPWETDLVSFFVSKSSSGKKLRALAAEDFSTDLATDGLLPLAMPTGVLATLRGAGSRVYLYSGDVGEAWAGAVDCTLPVSAVAPAVTSVAFSTVAPVVDETVTVSCTATPGTSPVGSYLISFGDGESYAGPAPTTTHAWLTEGTKTVACTAFDVDGLASSPLSALVDVVAPLPSFTLTVGKIGTGSGLVTSIPTALSCGSVCSEAFPTGTTVTLTALSSPGSRFAGWSGAGCSGVEPCSIQVTEAARVTASFLPEAGTRFVPVAPCRIADTRVDTGVPLAAGEVRSFDVLGSGCGVPPAAQALSLNVTVVEAAAEGSLSVFPAGAEIPGTQVVSFAADRTRAASAVIQLGVDGALSAYNASAGPVHVILDVNGAFQ